mmetsp:Transcript_21113/g.39435  ORF Transcript_21113/g.39435 Transcript_21113/m.39435 type:complete len:99 (-) Transcript_21113:399-695(-)
MMGKLAPKMASQQLQCLEDQQLQLLLEEGDKPCCLPMAAKKTRAEDPKWRNSMAKLIVLQDQSIRKIWMKERKEHNQKVDKLPLSSYQGEDLQVYRKN